MRFRDWVDSGAPWIWLNAGAVAGALVMVIGLLLLVAARGLGHFWPADVIVFDYLEGGETRKVMGEVVDSEIIAGDRLRHLGIQPVAGTTGVTRLLIKIGNRDLTGNDFQWFLESDMRGGEAAAGIVVLEREEWGNFYGRLAAVAEGGAPVAVPDLMMALQERLARRHAIVEQIRHIEKDRIGAINYRIEQLRLDDRRLVLDGITDPDAHRRIGEERQAMQVEYDQMSAELARLYTELRRDAVQVQTADGRTVDIPLAKVIRAYNPNDMGVLEKLSHYGIKVAEFVSVDPREANTEGGIFPAIFGTVLMVVIMSVLVTPFGVIAAVYLSEYAKQGPLTRAIRIAVNNLAGVPSVVYGVFGLGFFVYFIGAHIDRAFFAEALPAPTFGTPGLLWSSLTLALLTVPVVIVSTEEGLSRIPKAIREGSLALGATKAETLWRTVMPMATPAMMTGLILAVARAAGEVAPLMMVGVVKLAPSLPFDGNFPFLHLERKFMHLGFHIYDVGFQSPNVEAARPLVYATALLLVLIVVILNLAAIRIRNRLREKYNAAET
jgi:phosphate transport system permease protein